MNSTSLIIARKLSWILRRPLTCRVSSETTRKYGPWFSKRAVLTTNSDNTDVKRMVDEGKPVSSGTSKLASSKVSAQSQGPIHSTQTLVLNIKQPTSSQNVKGRSLPNRNSNVESPGTPSTTIEVTYFAAPVDRSFLHFLSTHSTGVIMRDTCEYPEPDLSLNKNLTADRDLGLHRCA